MLDRIARWLLRRSYRNFLKAARRAYPNSEDRANGLLAEGAELVSIEFFSQGNPLRSITITPDDKCGYHIHIEGIHDTEEAINE